MQPTGSSFPRSLKGRPSLHTVRPLLRAWALVAGSLTLAATLPAHGGATVRKTAGTQESEPQQVQISYIAHASFQLTSPDGTRVVFDPFNDHIWLGYQFPEGIGADLVLISHPHYDHDASYSVDGDPVVLRLPATAQFGDVTLLGARGKHSDPYGKEFGQRNTVWKVEMTGISFVHWGDNGPITDALVAELGKVDVLFLPIDGDQHILQDGQVTEIVERLQPRFLIPMHFKIPSLSTEPRSLGFLDPWLERVRSGAARVSVNNKTPVPVQTIEGSVFPLDPSHLPKVTEILVFSPDARVTAWSQAYRTSQRLIKAARESTAAEALPVLEKAVKIYPRGIHGWRALAARHFEMGNLKLAIATLETGLVRAAGDDWTNTARARNALASLYQKINLPGLAAAQYRWVMEHCANLDLRQQATEGLMELGKSG